VITLYPNTENLVLWARSEITGFEKDKNSLFESESSKKSKLIRLCDGWE
jgi:hypothetical protein